MVESYQQGLISKYIKYILSNTYLPMLPLIDVGDIMIEGVRYVHKNKILLCTASGIFYTGATKVDKLKRLTASEFLSVTAKNQYMRIYDDVTGEYLTTYLTDNQGNYIDEEGEIIKEGSSKVITDLFPLVVTDKLVDLSEYQSAQYDIVDDYLVGSYVPNVTEQFTSNTQYYDDMTHKKLGQYLRWIKNQYDVNLMSMYNCYNYQQDEKISLSSSIESSEDESEREETTAQGLIGYQGKQGYTTLLVPIKYNKPYTIAIECGLPIYLGAVIYEDELVADSDGKYLCNKLVNNGIIRRGFSRFNTPFSYTISNVDKELFSFESLLYLAIQVPKNLKSTVVVLEGDFTENKTTHIIDIQAVTGTIEQTQFTDLDKILQSDVSLLKTNDTRQYPYADKLLQYILTNTIDPRDLISEDITRVEHMCSFNPKYYGQWCDELRYRLYIRYMNIADKYELNKSDIIGYVDNDIENALQRGYLK